MRKLIDIKEEDVQPLKILAVKANKLFKPLLRRLIKYCLWLANNYNPNISDKTIKYLRAHKRISEKLGIEPLSLGGFYEKEGVNKLSTE